MSGADVLAPDARLRAQLDSWLPSEEVREPLFASNARKLYRH